MTSNSDKHRTQNGNGKQKDLWVNQQVSFIFLQKKNISDEEKETTQLSTTNEQLNEQTSEQTN